MIHISKWRADEVKREMTLWWRRPSNTDIHAGRGIASLLRHCLFLWELRLIRLQVMGSAFEKRNPSVSGLLGIRFMQHKSNFMRFQKPRATGTGDKRNNPDLALILISTKARHGCKRWKRCYRLKGGKLPAWDRLGFLFSQLRERRSR